MTERQALLIAVLLAGAVFAGHAVMWAGFVAGERFTWAVGIALTIAAGIMWGATRIVARREGWDV